MAFKKFSSYLEEKNGKFFTLRNDKDFADVVFLYQSYDDMMVCDAHYLKTNSYEGYAECLQEDYHQCPACSYGEKGIRKEVKLFIPLFNLTKGCIEFWDRSQSFEGVINDAVFKNYPNPSEYVFRITRHGQPRDVNTRYEIVAQGRNANYPYEKILADFNLSFPESYSTVCKSMTPDDMSSCLSNRGSSSDLGDYSYTPVPRGGSVTSDTDAAPELPQVDVPIPEYSAPPSDLPEMNTDPADTSADSDDSLDDVSF